MAVNPARGDSAPDAVVVGAGHNGLVAANLLADAGWDVVVCEATEHIGGATRSGSVTAPGYTSDLFSAFYPLAAASPILAALDLENHGLRWSHAPDVLAHVLPDGRCAVLSRDLDRTVESVSSFAEPDGAAFRTMVAQWQQIEPHVLQTLFRPFPPVRPAAALARSLGMAGAARLTRMALQPVRRFGEEWFEGDGARILFAGNAMHADISPDGAGSAVYGWLMTMLGQTHGFPVPVGGAGRLSDALTHRLIAGGGTVRTHAPVERVLLREGTAVGVRLKSGERIHARRAVLADVNAPELYGSLLSAVDLPPRFLQDMKNFQWDTPTLKIDWALAGPVPWQAQGPRRAGTVQLGVDVDGLTTYSAALAKREIPREPFILFGQMSTADASRSPEGTESAWAYTHLPIRDHLTEDDIDRHVTLVEQTIQRHAPGFTDLILARYVQSPTRLARENPNLRHGAINGGTAQLHQQLIFRPTVGLGGAATPIDRLFLAGSSAHPGGGVHGGPGSNAARAALGRAGWTGPLKRAVTSALLTRLYRSEQTRDTNPIPRIDRADLAPRGRADQPFESSARGRLNSTTALD